MRTLNFASRSFKEIIRDPLSIIFALLLPVFLLVIFRQFDIPNEAYLLENFTPGIIVFGFSFISMFTATLVAKDRSSSLLTRLCISPMKGGEYVLGYILSLFPLVLMQAVLFFAVALILGLELNLGVLYCVLLTLLLSVLYISIGIALGSITTEKSSAGVSSVIVQLVAFTSGMYFPKELLGKGFQVVCDVLPFSHTVNILKCGLSQSTTYLLTYSLVFLAYAIAITALACVLFKRNMCKR